MGIFSISIGYAVILVAHDLLISLLCSISAAQSEEKAKKEDGVKKS